MSKNVRRRVEARIQATEPHILKRQKFDPEKFLGDNWSIDEQVGQRTGDILDAGKIIQKNYLKNDESHINGEEWLKRIKQAPEDIQLDANDFLALWLEKDHVILKWLYDTKSITCLSFWGTPLRDPDGRRHVLYLCRDRDGSWYWRCDWVGFDWDADDSASLLASSN